MTNQTQTQYTVDEIEITWNPESLFGDMRSADIEGVDVDATVDSYDDQLLLDLAEAFPQAKITVRRQTPLMETKRYVHISPDVAPGDEGVSVSDLNDYYAAQVNAEEAVQAIDESVWDRQEFWVEMAR